MIRTPSTLIHPSVHAGQRGVDDVVDMVELPGVLGIGRAQLIRLCFRIELTQQPEPFVWYALPNERARMVPVCGDNQVSSQVLSGHLRCTVLSRPKGERGAADRLSISS